MAKGYVTIDLAATWGSMKLRPGTPLPRHDKKAVELVVANKFLQSLQDPGKGEFADIQSNSKDPPDILFEMDHETIGLELTELLPQNRLERTAVIRKFKQRILQKLALGPHSRDWLISIMLAEDYAAKIRLRCEAELAAALDAFFSSSHRGVRTQKELPIPGSVQHSIRRVHALPWDLTGDPRIQTRDQPLIIFSAQHTLVVPDRDFPTMLETVVGRKARHDLALRTWLLLWSNHQAFGSLNDELVRHIKLYLRQHEIRYERLFYLHLHLEPCLTEFALLPSSPQDEGRSA